MLKFLGTVDEDSLIRKLLFYGLFPENLLPIFSSKLFGRWILKEGILTYKSKEFSCIKYRLTRNNNAPRIMEIPHPIAYSRLCMEIKSSWKKIRSKIGEVEDYEERSMIRPKPNNLNARLLSMKSYNKEENENLLILDKSFGKKYYVHADITNCYPSIYSHSIPWALVGHQEAKNNIGDQKLWYNKLDFAIRSMQRNETVGIAIGPDTSGIISELVLSRIDKELSNYSYLRYIDDYKCYCSTKEEADEFIRKLSRELEKYHLRLNTKKTEIKELPLQLQEDWVNRLSEYSSNFLKKKTYGLKDKNTITGFIDLSVNLSRLYPGESPVKYAVKVLSRKQFDTILLKYIILYLFRISFIYPYLIDSLNDLIIRNHKKITPDLLNIIKAEIDLLLNEHIKYSRSDVAVWCLFLSLKLNFTIDNFRQIADQLITDRDCLPVLMCYKYSKINEPGSIKKYLSLIKEIIDEKNEDEWWLYIYHLYKEYPTKVVFKKIAYKEFYESMRKGKVSFFTKDTHSLTKIHSKSTIRIKSLS